MVNKSLIPNTTPVQGTRLVSTSGTSNKEYTVYVSPTDSVPPRYTVWAAYGPIGRASSKAGKTTWPTLTLAHAAALKLLQEKLAKGYRQEGTPAIPLAARDSGRPSAPPSPAPPPPAQAADVEASRAWLRASDDLVI